MGWDGRDKYVPWTTLHNNKELISADYNLTYSHLQYAANVWGGVGITSFERINVMNNKVIRQ